MRMRIAFVRLCQAQRTGCVLESASRRGSRDQAREQCTILRTNNGRLINRFVGSGWALGFGDGRRRMRWAHNHARRVHSATYKSTIVREHYVEIAKPFTLILNVFCVNCFVLCWTIWSPCRNAGNAKKAEPRTHKALIISTSYHHHHPHL